MISKYKWKPQRFCIYRKTRFNISWEIFYEKLNCGNNNKDFYKGKVVVLVNEKNSKPSRILQLWYFKQLITMTIGSQTAGADGNVSTIIYRRL
jgi:hypothetical protein